MTGFISQHLAHAIMLGGPVVLVAGMLLTLYLTRPDRPVRAQGAPHSPTGRALRALVRKTAGIRR